MTDTSEREPHVRVTLEQIYETVIEARDAARGVTKLAEAHDTQLDDHEGRIRGLEKIVWRASGVSALLSAVLTALTVNYFNGG